MMRLRIAVLVGLIAVASSRADGAEVAVGVARVDISPDGPVRLHGYLARNAESKGTAHKIWAKALAIGSDEQKPVVLVSVDNLGVSDAIIDEVAARLAKKTGLPRERLAVGSSHAHTAPMLSGVAPNIFGKPIVADEQARIDQYTRGFIDKLERVCLDALAARQPATLSWAQGKVGFAANRRTPGGPVDHSLPVLKVTAPDGSIRAILTNYACHCTSIEPDVNLVDGDWAGSAQAAIEADNPGCIALTVVGCGADSNPSPRGKPELAVAHGRALADEVARLLRGSWTPLSGPPRVAFERFNLPYDVLPTRAELEALVKAGGPPGYNASVQLARLDRGEPLPESLPYSAQAWEFGDGLLMVFLPGEVVVDFVLRLKKEFDASRLWVTAYANDVPCYIPSERILREGGYEGGGAMVYYARPTRLKPGVEKLIIDAVHRVAGPEFQAPTKKAEADEEHPPALTPEESRKAFRTKPGLKVELVASEPLIESPIAIDFGADGRLWVCEMRDYPAGMDGRYKPGGAIKVLEDRDHDGRYDTAVTFLDGLPFPTGVMCWRKGVLICAAPEIIYAEDTDGDGKADVRRTLYKGFSTENYQARVNGLSYGIDNWVYGANGLIGGAIHGQADGREVDIGGRDFRFRPDSGVFEPASGLTQQGRIHDDWGNQFGGDSGSLIRHYPLSDHDVSRNLRVVAPVPGAFHSLDADPGRLFPASRTLARFNDPNQANRVTSACGPGIYRDSLLGPEYTGDAFTCESVHNVVRRNVMRPDGVTFTGRRADDEQQSEFLASTDSWHRPVQVRTGPDGALWVVDMYRFVIEHPRWISPERLATLDVRAGADKGRIYRVVPEGRPLRPVPNLDALATPDLALAIESPNGTLRDNVQRVLVHRGDHAAALTLARLVRESKLPECRVQALAALDGLEALDDATIAKALADAHPGVRRQAVRLSESRLARNADLGRVVLALAADPEITVRFQVALSLGEWPAPEAGRALASIAVRDASDPWVRAAVLSSAVPHAQTVLERVVASAGPDGPSTDLVEPLIATIAGAHDRESVALALKVVAGEPRPWRLGAIAELLDASRDDSLAADPAVRPTILAARALAADPNSPPADRIAALRLLGRSAPTRDADRAVIAERVDPAEPTEIQVAALRALARLGDRASASAVVDRWNQLGPTLRATALDSLIARDESAEVLLSAIEAGRVAPSQIGAEQRQRLMATGPPALRNRAEAAFGALKIGPRKPVLDAYASVKSAHGDPMRGKAVFERACAICHKFDGVGHEVGPDLAALTDLSPEPLLIAILDPNREVDARYVSYNAALKDGRVVAGLIAAETASAVSLKRQEGATDVILRADLDELTSSGRSLMPEGLENDLKPADVADVVAFLSKGSSRPKAFDGNHPVVVKQGKEGVVRLDGASAAIYGPSLTFESEFGNLGYWHSPDDHAAWTFQVDRGSTFTVALDWACDDEAAGNAYTLELDGRPVRGVVAGTGGWANYEVKSVADQVFHNGLHRVALRSDGPIRNALADVRAIVLTPGEAPSGQAPADPPVTAEAEPVEAIARAILDPKTTDADREALVARRPEQSAELIAALADGLGGDLKEEYRRIPWIWRVAIAAGRRNDAAEIRRILDVALPAADAAKLDDWRAVVLGGGLINGVSQTGPFPGPRFQEVVRDAPPLAARWRRSLDLAATMADAETVSTGTRYDALRMLGVEPWDKCGGQIAGYLSDKVDPELQQGAVSALNDVDSSQAASALASTLDQLTPSNRKLAIVALTRDDARRSKLLDAIEAGRARSDELTDEARRILLDPARGQSVERARRILTP
ncbi:MAG: neutral/alkaline non-lysosomal ceramidase N-terminal domain-containing protein [Paludisphaera borealis]|uniref:neutral/alkaline non-lysosomal ceramidase N-terminal domain-containing protein n=1 Tax=Paludisphaera borealis TaxID=1387353 RepID=UPI00284FC870|nr:neutral/alkaline non-lysosomal ceramidase N-terminal domain-containing protein [Paludisphaera borealis]MDR3621278.1 neutral/alkaline non-lysosomal ceramidase N-terminal domain-containing protein [Paludisphaera borealis]